MNRTQIVQLNSALKDVIEFRRYEEERGNPLVPIGAGVAGAGALGAGALYTRGRFMEGPVRQGFGGVMDTMKQGYAGFGRDYTRTANYAKGVGGIAQGAGEGFGQLRKSGVGVLDSIKSAGKLGFRALRGLKFSSKSPIIELNAQLREVLTFGEAE
jgi:hypothetical protein